MSASTEVRTDLLAAIEAQDAVAFELAVISAFTAGLPHDLADVFTDALPNALAYAS